MGKNAGSENLKAWMWLPRTHIKYQAEWPVSTQADLESSLASAWPKVQTSGSAAVLISIQYGRRIIEKDTNILLWPPYVQNHVHVLAHILTCM